MKDCSMFHSIAAALVDMNTAAVIDRCQRHGITRFWLRRQPSQ